MRSMRYILWVCLGLGVLWGGYWFVGARAIESNVRAWFANESAAGLVAETSGVSVAGFADRFDLTVSGLHLADPASGWGWKAPFAQVLAMTWKPWHLIAALPHTQEADLPDGQKVTIASSRLMASLLMQPALTFGFTRAIVEGEGVNLTSDANWTAGAEKAVLAAENDPTRKNTLRLGADLTNLALPAALAAGTDLGGTIALVHLDAHVTLSQPLDLAMTNPDVVAAGIAALHMVWGALELTGEGQVKPDAQGLAEGKIDLSLKGWRKVPDVVVALGLVPPANRVTVLRGLEFLAASGGDPTVLNLPLTFKDGYMSLGPLPLGPAPRLVQAQ
ncbi:DUF2125 domain-containing protein [bacterium]|nr:DUF2125 domain-containing protein [bacterium]